MELMQLEKSMGFRSAFNFVAEDYPADRMLRRRLVDEGFEIGLHGVNHGGNIFKSEKVFRDEAQRINRYLKEWNCAGFRAPRMYHDLEKAHQLDIEYDASTFDTDPFEPQPDGVRTIFPFFVQNGAPDSGYVELPYTLPQDFTLFVLMGHKDIGLWKEKLRWIAENGGMALLITHPDYMRFNGEKPGSRRVPCGLLPGIPGAYQDDLRGPVLERPAEGCGEVPQGHRCPRGAAPRAEDPCLHALLFLLRERQPGHALRRGPCQARRRGRRDLPEGSGSSALGRR